MTQIKYTFFNPKISHSLGCHIVYKYHRHRGATIVLKYSSVSQTFNLCPLQIQNYSNEQTIVRSSLHSHSLVPTERLIGRNSYEKLKAYHSNAILICGTHHNFLGIVMLQKNYTNR